MISLPSRTLSLRIYAVQDEAWVQRLEMEQAKRNQNKEDGMSPGDGRYAS